MKKFFAIASLFVLFGAGCGSSTQPAPAIPAQKAAAPAPAVEATAQPTPKMTDIAIKNFTYSPQGITVQKGEKITITNQDAIGHTLTADNNAFDSGMLGKGEKYVLDTGTLEPGTYAFHCTPHPYMKGTITVQ